MFVIYQNKLIMLIEYNCGDGLVIKDFKNLKFG